VRGTSALGKKKGWLLVFLHQVRGKVGQRNHIIMYGERLASVISALSQREDWPGEPQH
jgi:hypothetical protein